MPHSGQVQRVYRKITWYNNHEGANLSFHMNQEIKQGLLITIRYVGILLEIKRFQPYLMCFDRNASELENVGEQITLWKYVTLG